MTRTASVVLWINIRLWCGGRGSGLKDSILFLEIVCFLFLGEQRTCDGRGGGARSALFSVLISPKRWVRAAHGRARAAKTH
jgi:hypothetical protein